MHPPHPYRSPLSFLCFLFFFFNDTATTEIYTLSLHDALPISNSTSDTFAQVDPSTLSLRVSPKPTEWADTNGDRKSTRLNSSHANISYAVFCLKKKKQQEPQLPDLSLQREQHDCPM